MQDEHKSPGTPESVDDADFDTPVEDMATPARWTLISDMLVLQVKLIFDGFRDFMLVPVSLVAGIISLLQTGDKAGTAFYELLHLGRRSERWINLFGAADRVTRPQPEESDSSLRDIDSIVEGLESYIIEEYRKGGVTATAKARLDSALDTLARAANRDRG